MPDTGWIHVAASRDDSNPNGSIRLRVVNGALQTTSLGEGSGVTATPVDIATDSTTVSAAPAYLTGIYVNTALSAHPVLITDAAVTKFILPASAAAGTFYPFEGEFLTSLIVNPDDAATGNITVMWRAL